MYFFIIKHEKCNLSRPIKSETVSPSVRSIMPTLEHGQIVHLQEVTSLNWRVEVHALLAVQIQVNKHLPSPQAWKRDIKKALDMPQVVMDVQLENNVEDVT